MAALDLANNHLALEPVIIARLKTVRDLQAVGGAYEFDSMLSAGEPAPAAFVLYGGDEAETIPGQFAQIWQVVLVGRASLDEDKCSLTALGKLQAKIIECLFGAAWQPADNAMPPARVYDGSDPVIYADGLVHLIFNLRVVLTMALTQNNRWT